MQGCWYLMRFNLMDKPTDNQIKFLEMLQTLTDAELSHHFPKLDHLTRDEKIKCIVFNLNCKNY